MALYKCGGDTKYKKLYEQEVSAYNTLNNNYNVLNSTYGNLSSLTDIKIHLGYTGINVYQTASLDYYPIYIAVSGAIGSFTYIDTNGNTRTIHYNDGVGDGNFKVLPDNPNDGGNMKYYKYLNIYRLHVTSISWCESNTGSYSYLLML